MIQSYVVVPLARRVFGDLVLFRDSIQSAGGGAWRLHRMAYKPWFTEAKWRFTMVYLAKTKQKKTWWTHQNDHGGVTLLDFIWFRGFYMSEGPGLLRQVRKIDV